MDLVFALDDRFQDGVVDVAAIAPIARLLGVDTIWVADDVAFDRFRLARPEIVDDLLTGAGARGRRPAPGRAVRRAGTEHRRRFRVVDEQSVERPPRRSNRSPRCRWSVSTTRWRRSGRRTTSVVLSGSGDGLVDAAAAGVIDGSELILYSASFER